MAKGNMGYVGNESSVEDTLSRASNLKAVFTDHSLLEQNIQLVNAEREISALNKIQKYKSSILKTQLKEEENYLKKVEALKKKYSGAEFKRKQDELTKQYDLEKDKIIEKYKLIAAQEESLAKGKVGGLIVGLKNAGRNQQEFGGTAGLSTAMNAIASFVKQFDNQIEEIAGYQTKANTRLHGSTRRWDGIFGIANRITGVTGASAFVKTSDVMKSVNDLINRGISYNVEQRAFLQTISESIATTFDAANGTLLNLVRIQQADTTAARLGMEASLNTYLNSMYQTTEYLSDASSSVKESIYQATALMSATEGVAFEYQVQKWLGSLYSVGMSNQAVNNIAAALGMLGSGDVSGLSGNSMQNLMVMAASRAGLSYSDLLVNGLNESNTNKLLESMVDYLSDIANSNKVVQSQYAQIFGLTTSDIKAAVNLSRSTKGIASSSLGYGGSMAYLNLMAETIGTRMSVGGMLSNIWDNVQYSISNGIASNPAMYAIWKASNVLDDVAGGIAIPAISAMGSGVDLETTVADIMKVAALSGGLLGSIGTITSSLTANAAGAAGMLGLLGINNGLSTVTRGNGGLSTVVSGASVSSSTYVGNSSGSDIQNATMATAEDQKSEIAAKEDDSDKATTDTIQEHIIDIYQLLSGVIDSSGSMRVSIENPYGG